MQFVEISVVKSSGFWIQSWFSGLTWVNMGLFRTPVTRSYLNAESCYANTNDLLNVAFRCRKPLVNR